MPIDNELLEILICPETKQPLTIASAEIIDPLNLEIEAKRLRNRGGDVVQDRIEEALLREDGRILYIVDESIPVMLIDQSIELA